MTRRALFLSLSFLAIAAPALAEERLSDAQLDAARGGYLVAGELAFQFGAVMSTYANGALVLQTQVTWTDQGAMISRLTGEAQAGLAGGEIAGSAVASSDPTTVIQNVENRQLVNILLNTASDQVLRQQTDITLTLPGFAATQTDIGRALVSQRLLDDISLGAVGSID